MLSVLYYGLTILLAALLKDLRSEISRVVAAVL